MSPDTLRTAFGAAVLLPVGLGLNFLLSLVLARQLSVDDFGLFGFVQSFAAILAVIATLGFSQSTMRFTAAYRATGDIARLGGLLRFSRRTVFLASIAFASVLGGLAWLLPAYRTPLLWTAALLVPYTMDAWRESAVRGLHRISAAIAPRAVLLPLVFLLLLPVLELTDGSRTLGAFLAMFLIIEGIALYWLRQQEQALMAGIKPEYCRREWVQVSLPMIGSTLGALSLTRFDIVLVGLILGMQEAGVYTAASRTALLVSLVLRVVSLVFGPKFAESYHGGNHARFKHLFIRATQLAILLGLPFYGMLMAFPGLVLGIFGDNYRDGITILQILATAQFVNLITGPAALALNMARYQKQLAIASLICGAVAVPVVGVATFIAGLLGAALAASSVVVVFNLISLYLLVRRL